MINYLKKLESNPIIINQKVRKNTINSIINEFSTFLKINCPHCFINMVDPVGTKKYITCGNCGYSKEFNR
jgi:ribosomal protein S27E